MVDNELLKDEGEDWLPKYSFLIIGFIVFALVAEIVLVPLGIWKLIELLAKLF